MFERLNAFLSTKSSRQLWIALPLLVLIIGVLDLASGYELSFSIFYVLPVGMAAWRGNKHLATFLCLLGAAVWLAVDQASGHHYSHPAIAYWNACVRLGYFLIIAQLLIRLRRAIETERAHAQLDGLTGLLNARVFQQRCKHELRLAGRHARSLTLGYLDLDGFKGINDKFGHSFGDMVLKQVASTLAARLRDTDSAARMGGDEFALLLPETDLQGAQILFSEIRERLLALANEQQWPLGFSIGVAVFSSPSATTEQAINFADQLMYQVKNSGKNAIRLEQYPGPGNTAKV